MTDELLVSNVIISLMHGISHTHPDTRLLPMPFGVVAMVALGLQLAGCARLEIRAGGTGGDVVTSATTQVKVSTGSTLGIAFIAGILAADSVNYFRQAPDGTRTLIAPPASAPPRVSVQDCSQPIDSGAGNLICR